MALYDLLLLFMVDVVLLVLYKGMEGLDPIDIVVQGITAAACIFFMRWFWKVYSQVWRYGGIQSYIRLFVFDGCAFLLYYLVEQFLPIRHISFARVLCISCLSLLDSLTIRMVYRYAYKCREYIFGSDSVGSIHGLRSNSVFLSLLFSILFDGACRCCWEREKSESSESGPSCPHGKRTGETASGDEALPIAYQ